MKKEITYLSLVLKKFEAPYIALRQKEGRIYSIEQIRRLPLAEKTDPLLWEWKIRKHSADRFTAYFREKKFRHVLEIGCGNGWFSNYMAKNTGAEKVTGLDLNEFELKQAAEAFNSPKLSWIYADIFSTDLDNDYDVTVLNSSVQYFPDLKKLTGRLNNLLRKGGEIHIMDSPFYNTEKEKAEAQKRTEQYYEKIGALVMTGNYFHHLKTSLDEFNPVFLYHPTPYGRLIGKISRKIQSPFPWIMIKRF